MGRLFNNLKRIFEKGQAEGSQDIYRPMLEKFVTLITYEDLYLMKLQSNYIVLRQNGSDDMLIDCGGFGILIDKDDKISIHT